MKMVDKFDQWVASGPFTAHDLGIYRIIYAACALFTAPDITYLTQYPKFMFHPPPGPLQLLSEIPSLPVLITFELLRSISLVLLGLGLWTRFASVTSALMLSLTYGLTYCLGRTDHTILIVLAPLVLVFANWGSSYSLDSRRHKDAVPPQQQWPLRLYALLIGWGFFVAALVKIATGWLSFSSQAARGYFILSYMTEVRTYGFSTWMATHDPHALWEFVDWLTVIFEASILIALPWWRAFRITLAVAAVFHLSVLLIMGIDFSHAVVAYGAFVSWGAIAHRLAEFKICRSIVAFIRTPRSGIGSLGPGLAPWVFGVTAGAGAWFLTISPIGRTSTGLVCGDLIILVGAAIGVIYLVREFIACLPTRQK